jgi:hypothetical protein
MTPELQEVCDRFERLGWAFVWALSEHWRSGSNSLYRLRDLARAQVLAPPTEAEESEG